MDHPDKPAGGQGARRGAESDLPALRAVGAHFGRVAEADARQMLRQRRSRRMRGWAAAAVVVAAGAGGVAVATELIAIGSPQPDQAEKGDRYRPVAEGSIDVTAPDTPLRWGVEVYANRSGQSCALVGQLRGSALGIVKGQVFRPYSAATATTCIDASNAYRVDVKRYPGRTIVYGIARDPVARIQLIRDGRSDQADVGPRGAFLFVLTEDLQLGTLQVLARRSDGRVVR